VLALVLVAPAVPTALATATADGTSSADPVEQRPTPRKVLDTLAWSSEHDDTLLSPLVSATATQGGTEDLRAAYDAGRAWADARLSTADRPALEDALVALYAHAPADIGPEAMDTDTVPRPYVAPLAVLVQLAAHEQIEPTPLTPDPRANAHASAERLAFTAGALEPARAALHDARAGSPVDEVTPLDPLGLVVLGSTGDDTYDPHTIAEPFRWQGPIVLVEPGGDDTYNVPVASRSLLDTVPILGFDTWSIDYGGLALELAGNDTYNSDVAKSRSRYPQVMLEERGDDTYGHLGLQRSIAYTSSGQALLHDEQGNDTYQVEDRGLAHANSLTTRQESIAILADKNGNDTYHAYTAPEPNEATQGRTHAFAENAGAIAHMRDYSGDDAYISNLISLARAGDDGTAFFWEQQGGERYYLPTLGPEFGVKSLEERGVISAPAQRSPVYFLDSKGADTYSWDSVCGICTIPHYPENGKTEVDTNPERRWGIFVDCQADSGDPVPCPDEQRRVLERVLEGERP
jgi:hypothetical protein